MRHFFPTVWCVVLLVMNLVACGDEGEEKKADRPVASPPPPAEAPPPPPVVEATAPMLQAVPFWEDGKAAGKIDALGPDRQKYLVLDLGEAWVPYLFTHGTDEEGGDVKHAYRKTYLQLAQERFPQNLHGERAKDDKYLELYGIMPTFAVLRKRMKWAVKLACAKTLELSALADFDDFVPFAGHHTAHNTRSRYLVSRRHVNRYLKAQEVETAEELDASKLESYERGHLRYYLRHHARYEAVAAAQARLKCEGFLPKKSPSKTGALDWPTHEALAAFERRHRVYGWGYIGRDTLEILQKDTAQSEREAVLRVLTERAMHSYRAIEDGSFNDAEGNPPTFKGRDGKMHPVPNLEKELSEHIERAFGLKDPEATLDWLNGLGKLPADGHMLVALPAPPRPEYHSDNMDLLVEIDRGDVWYEFPYDEKGEQRRQPVSRRPRTKLYTRYNGQKIPLARFGTTIGGWRSELVNEVVSWKYKNSPPGEVIWKNIVSAPVWLPPDSTPHRDILKRREHRKPGEPKYYVNYHETGPSYASAYGLVAAYHKEFVKTPEGEYRITHDDGIRSHGSVDYMSIMRRHSHGCHRLHNHLAVRLFAFVLNHRPHKRVGHYPLTFIKELEYEGEQHTLEVRKGGYIFSLEQPIHVDVHEGRILGSVPRPLETAVPKFNRHWGAYFLPDGGAVRPTPTGKLVSVPRPPIPDGGVEGGILYGVVVDPSAVPKPEGQDAGVVQPVLPDVPRPISIPTGGVSPIALPSM